MTGLRGLDVAEERRLGGTVGGTLWASAAATVLILMALPGVPHNHWRIVVAVAAVCLTWGVTCLKAIRWETAPPWVAHFSTILGYPVTAVGVAATGGASSPAHLYLFFLVAYCAYFYAAREAAPYLSLCIAVTVLPLFYDAGAVREGFLGDALILTACWVLLGGFINIGKGRLVELREHAQTLALTDPLTGLHNRRALIERLERLVADESAATALLFVDMDFFKDVNTLYGHPVGDRVLCATADALRRAARAGDMVARHGGDEFAVVLDGADQREALTVAHRVLHEVREAALALELPQLRVSASVGYAIAEPGGDVAALMAAADIALRGSKRGGKDRASSPLDGARA